MSSINPIVTCTINQSKTSPTITNLNDIFSPYSGRTTFSPAPTYTSPVHISPTTRASTFSSWHKKQLLATADINQTIKILQKQHALRTGQDMDLLVDFFEHFQILSPEIDCLIAKDTFTQFIAATQYKHIPKHQHVFQPNDEANEFYFVLQGEAEIVEPNDNTKHILDSGNIFGEPAMFDHHPRNTFCQAVGSNGVQLAFWDRKTYNQFITPIENFSVFKFKQFSHDHENDSIFTRNSVLSPTNVSTSKDMESKIDNDIDTCTVWSACCDPEDDTFAYFNALYPILCEVFVQHTGCKAPLRKDLEFILIRHGAKRTRLSDIHYPDTRNYQVIISAETFNTFFEWFKSMFDIVRELSFLYDLGCDLFCSVDECEKLLKKNPEGTFMLRVSDMNHGVTLSYRRERSYKRKLYKHVDIIRKDVNEYQVFKKKKSARTSIRKLIRSFVKVQYLYTPRCLCVKKSVF
eukprot:212706_1